jgi:hypothetical protein
MLTPEQFNHRGVDKLPGHLGIVITHGSAASEVRAELEVKKALMAPNGFLHLHDPQRGASTVSGQVPWETQVDWHDLGFVAEESGKGANRYHRRHH